MTANTPLKAPMGHLSDSVRPRQSVVLPERVAKPAPRTRKPINWVRVGLWIALVLTTLVWSFPILILFFTSVRTPAEIASANPWDIPTTWHWENFAIAWRRGDLGTTGLNSLVLSLIKVPLGLFVSAAAAFAISRLRFRGHRVLLMVITVGSMVPIQVALGPLFNVMLELDQLDSLPGLLLPYIAFGVPYSVFILYGFFRGIPDELEESARIDGASTFRIFIQIILPLAKPALAALFILDFVATWNEYAMAQTLLRSQANWTVPLAVQSFSSQHGTDFGPLTAFILMSAIPVLIVYLLFQKHFVQGALAGAVKG